MSNLSVFSLTLVLLVSSGRCHCLIHGHEDSPILRLLFYLLSWGLDPLFEFIFVDDVRKELKVIFLPVDIQLSQHLLLKRYFFLCWIALVPVLKISWLQPWSLFLDRQLGSTNSVPLIHTFILRLLDKVLIISFVFFVIFFFINYFIAHV